jgi:hypothetical protein
MQEPPGRPEPGRVWRSPVEYAARSKAGIVAGLSDARAGRLHAPAAADHVRRFLFGFTAPFTLLRVAWRDSQTRASLVDRLTIPVALMALALAIGVGSLVEDLVESRHHPAALAKEVDDDDDDDHGSADKAAKAARAASEDKAGKAASEAAIQAAVQARAEKKPVMEVASAAAAAAESAAQREKDAATADALAGADAPPHATAPPPGRGEVLRILGRFVESRLAKIIAVLGVLEWILVWIIREHHDLVAMQVSQLTGVPAEALAAPPRLRLDFGWLKLKAWRALRFLLFLALGSPPAWLLGAVPVIGPALAAVWEVAWAAYWASVFALANTFLAWEAPHEGDGAPWFVRAMRAPGRIPVVGWPFRLYAALLTKLTRAVWPACIAFEKAPWESAGLALARLVAGFPGLYLVCRPMFPPAATHALVARKEPSAPPSVGGAPAQGG